MYAITPVLRPCFEAKYRCLINLMSQGVTLTFTVLYWLKQSQNSAQDQ